MLSAIVATSNNGVIGKNGGLPWRMPADLKHFRDLSAGKPVVMGRKTHESIGRPLEGRQNIVLSRSPDYRAPGCVVVADWSSALAAAKGPEVCVIGGQAIYELAMPQLDVIYLTKIDADLPGDTFFKYEPADWRVLSSEKHSADADNPYSYEFLTLKRRGR